MSSIRKYILGQVMKQALSQEEAKKLLTELASPAPQEAGASAADHAVPAPAIQEIAIIGMAGRFPMANNAEQFWQLLRNGVNCIRPLPEPRRKDFEHVLRNPSFTEFLIGAPIPPDDVPFAHANAGYLEEVDKFDTAFFGIPPVEAMFMDPHQRLALELAWETMEDAGYGGRTLYGTNTGIYIGKEGTNHSLYRYTTVGNPMKLTGSWESILASRISYLFNFRGPCMVIDTACSSGLVSVHMAAQAIMNGDCDQAIAGGMNASITGEFNTRYQGSMAMDAVESKDGTIRTFDARANGTVWGEGVALVMLKPLARALADGDHIHAIIKGSAINNDGASNGLTAPNADAQTQVIIKAWQKAKIDPATLSYIEAHGTGTVLGDPIEFKGLTEAFRKFTPKRQFCAIGSLKTNMGHLVGCSGVASLFKVVKSLQAREMAPTINFGKPNPYINFLNGPLYVNDALRPWHSDGPRRAALSSFGFSHTNCHMVMEQAPERQSGAAPKAAYCFTLAAYNQQVLLDFVEHMRLFCQRDDWNLADVCYTMNTGRGHYPYRLAIIAADKEQLRQGLQQAAGLISGETSQPSAGTAITTTAATAAAATAASAMSSSGTATAGRQNAALLFHGKHEIVSEKKRQVEPHEITDKQKKALSDQSAGLLEQFLASGGQDRAQLSQIAQSYVTGADVPWTTFYRNEARLRVSLPPYPLQRIRVWPDPKISKIVALDSRLHPLVEQVASRSAQEVVFESRFNSNTHWVLSDHKIKGTCVVPGTTYLEMARFAAKEAEGWNEIELKDVFFLVPMVVEAGDTRRVRVRVRRGEGTANASNSAGNNGNSATGSNPGSGPHGAAGSISFEIESCALASEGSNNGGNTDGAGTTAADGDWVRHVEGRISPLSGTPRAPIDLAGLKARAHETIEEYQGVSDTGVFQFGQHWDATRAAWRIGDDALARLALPNVLQGELAVFRLHPSVLDNAVNLTSQTTGATYLPFTYKSFKMFAGFTPEMYTLVLPKGARGAKAADNAGAPDSTTAGNPAAGGGTTGKAVDVRSLPETLSYDVILTDQDGNVLCEIGDYVAKKVSNFAFGAPGAGADGEYLALRWVEQAASQDATTTPAAVAPAAVAPAAVASAAVASAATPDRSGATAAGKLALPAGKLLLVASGDLRQQDLLARALASHGVSVARLALLASGATVPAGVQGVAADEASMARLVASDALQDVAGVVFQVGGMAAAANAADFATARHVSVDALFHLGKALLTAKIKLPWGLALHTQQAFAVDGSESRIDPLGTASAALASVLGMENQHLPCRILDTAPASDDAGAQAIARQLLATPAGRPLALRAGKIWVREMHALRLAADTVPETAGADAATTPATNPAINATSNPASNPASNEASNAAPQPATNRAALRTDGVMLVTGGLGGLGLATAAYLADKGKHKVVLLGRSALAPRSEWAALANGNDKQAAKDVAKYAALNTLSGKLGALDYMACDIGNASELDAVLARVRAEHGPIRGVFHLAGVAGDGFLLRKTFERFDAVLKPKLEGSVNLYRATAQDDLDAFVLFSSITAVTGGEGQGDYAAANAFMDGLAWQARQDGRKLLALNWPSWKQIGMAADFAVDERHTPFVALNPEDAFARLDRVRAHGLVQILPSSLNAPAIAAVRDALPFVLAADLARKLAQFAAQADKQAGGAKGGPQAVTNVDDIKVAIRGKSEEELTPTEIILAKVYGVVLGLAEVDVFTNFQDMGGNSIIATHLLKVIDSQFPGLVDISDVFSYSSVDEMAAYVDEKRARLQPPPAATEADTANAASGTAAAPPAEVNWEDMIDQVLDDGASIDSILDKI